MAFSTLTILVALLDVASASYPPESARPTLEQRDTCIGKVAWKGCTELDSNRSSAEYEACKDVEDEVDEKMRETPLSEACHQMNVDADYGDYTDDKLTDDYYQCVADVSKIANKNEFYFNNEFTPLFVTCGVLQEQPNFLAADQRPTMEQRDDCIHNHSWNSCVGLDKTRSSAQYNACKAVEDKVEAMMDEGSTDACQSMKVDFDYGSYQDQLKDSYYQCVRDMSKVAETNSYYYANEFKPLFVVCGTLSDHESTITFV